MKHKKSNKKELMHLKASIENYLEIAGERIASADENCPKINVGLFVGNYDAYIKALREKAHENITEEEFYKIHNRELVEPYRKQISSTVKEIMNFRNWAICLNTSLENTSSDPYAELANIVAGEVTDVIKDRELHRFFAHDISHLLIDSMRMLGIGFAGLGLPMSNKYFVRKRDTIESELEAISKDPGQLFRQFTEPYKMIQFLVENELGQGYTKKEFSPKKLAEDISVVLRYRLFEMEYDVVDKFSETEKNEICIDAEDFKVNGCSGVVWSMIYNLAKNSIKKFEEEADGQPDKNKKMFIQIYEAPGDCYVLTVGDNGDGIDLMKMKKQLIGKIKDDGIDSIVFPSADSKKRVKEWQDSPYKYDDMHVGDITGVAFMARMSGFDQSRSQFSSGMGLYGLKHLTNVLGGRVLYGESKEGNPLFTVILPKNIPENKAEMQAYQERVAQTYTSIKNGKERVA